MIELTREEALWALASMEELLERRTQAIGSDILCDEERGLIRTLMPARNVPEIHYPADVDPSTIKHWYAPCTPGGRWRYR